MFDFLKPNKLDPAMEKLVQNLKHWEAYRCGWQEEKRYKDTVFYNYGNDARVKSGGSAKDDSEKIVAQFRKDFPHVNIDLPLEDKMQGR